MRFASRPGEASSDADNSTATHRCELRHTQLSVVVQGVPLVSVAYLFVRQARNPCCRRDCSPNHIGVIRTVHEFARPRHERRGASSAADRRGGCGGACLSVGGSGGSAGYGDAGGGRHRGGCHGAGGPSPPPRSPPIPGTPLCQDYVCSVTFRLEGSGTNTHSGDTQSAIIVSGVRDSSSTAQVRHCAPLGRTPRIERSHVRGYRFRRPGISQVMDLRALGAFQSRETFGFATPETAAVALACDIDEARRRLEALKDEEYVRPGSWSGYYLTPKGRDALKEAVWD